MLVSWIDMSRDGCRRCHIHRSGQSQSINAEASGKEKLYQIFSVRWCQRPAPTNVIDQPGYEQILRGGDARQYEPDLF